MQKQRRQEEHQESAKRREVALGIGASKGSGAAVSGKGQGQGPAAAAATGGSSASSSGLRRPDGLQRDPLFAAANEGAQRTRQSLQEKCQAFASRVGGGPLPFWLKPYRLEGPPTLPGLCAAPSGGAPQVAGPPSAQRGAGFAGPSPSSLPG